MIPACWCALWTAIARWSPVTRMTPPADSMHRLQNSEQYKYRLEVVFTEDVCYNSYVMQYYKRDRDYVVFGTDDGFVYIYGLQKNHLVSPSLSLECSPSWVVRTWTVPLSTSLQSRSPHPSCSSFPVREALPMRWSSCTGRYGQRKSDPKCAIASDMSITTPMCIPAAQATQSSAVVREY